MSSTRTNEVLVTCLSWGRSRYFFFPLKVFCDRCRYFETERLSNKRIKQTSDNFRCEIQHSDRPPNAMIVARNDANWPKEELGRSKRKRMPSQFLHGSFKKGSSEDDDSMENLSNSSDDPPDLPPLNHVDDIPTEVADVANPAVEPASTLPPLEVSDDAPVQLLKAEIILKGVQYSELLFQFNQVQAQKDVLKSEVAELKDKYSNVSDTFYLKNKELESSRRSLEADWKHFVGEKQKLDISQSKLESLEEACESLQLKKTSLERDISELKRLKGNKTRALNQLNKHYSEYSAPAITTSTSRRPRSTTTRRTSSDAGGKTDPNGKVAVFTKLKAGVDPTLAIIQVLTLSMPRSLDTSRANRGVQILWSHAFLGGLGRQWMIERVKTYLRQEVFTVPNVLKALDMSGIKCGYTAIEVIRRIDAPNKHEKSILPSSSGLQRGAELVQKRADLVVPYELFTTEDGEGFQFDVVRIARAGMRYYSVYEVAKLRSLTLSLTSDGAALNHRLTHLCAGIKWNDFALKDPFTKAPLLVMDASGNRKGGLQSRELTCILRLEIAKDNKNTAQRFKPLYDLLQSGTIEEQLGVKKFDLSFPHDKKAHWVLLDSGGAAKTKTQFCYCCNLVSSNIARANNKWCSFCTDNYSEEPDWECRHHDFIADGVEDHNIHARMSSMKDIIQDIDERIRLLKEKGSTMRIVGNSEIALQGDLSNIDYKPQSAAELIRFNAKITDELTWRGLPITGNRRQLLRTHLEAEQIAIELKNKLDFSSGNQNSFYKVIGAIPCILHLENRVGLTLIENILRAGLSKAVNGELPYITETGRLLRAKQYQDYITEVVETQILGTEDNKAHWRFPVDEKDKATMGSLKMENARTRAFIENIHLLIDGTYDLDDGERNVLIVALDHYHAALKILRQKNDYLEADFTSFQEHIDRAFNILITIFSESVCTNYTHDLIAGHVLHYMRHYGPLWRFSNEGWEALNALIKSFYFRRTFRGGLNKGSKHGKSRIRPIANYCQRRMMWMLGDAHNAFAVKKNPCAGLDLDGNPLEKEAEAEPVNMDTETELEMNDDDMEDFFVDTNELSDDEDTGAMFGML